MRKFSNKRRVVLASQPQADVLQQKMATAGLTHGQEVLATLTNVRVQNQPDGRKLYFCPMQSVEIIGQITPGDHGEIPQEVTIKDDALPGNRRMRDGYYDLINVVLCSNGSIQLSPTAKTRFKLITTDGY